MIREQYCMICLEVNKEALGLNASFKKNKSCVYKLLKINKTLGSNIPYPWDKVELVTLKNSSTCLGKGAAPDNMIRTRPPNACLIYIDYHIIRI